MGKPKRKFSRPNSNLSLNYCPRLLTNNFFHNLCYNKRVTSGCTIHLQGYVMKRLLIAMTAAVVLAFSTSAISNCTTFGSSTSCYDAQSGNSYNIQRYGNSTYMQGRNSSTGSSWNQNSHTYGNTTYHNGHSADGQSWSGSTSTYGSTSYQRGIDSNGNSYSQTCNQFGCN